MVEIKSAQQVIEDLSAAGFSPIHSLNDYAKAAESFELFPQHLGEIPGVPKWQVRFAHSSLGIGSENGELFEALKPLLVATRYGHIDVPNIIEEGGDRRWYQGVVHNVRDLIGGVTSLDQALINWTGRPVEADDRPLIEILTDLIIADGELANQAKRILFYRKPFQTELFVPAWEKSLRATFELDQFFGLDTLDVSRRNILKLHSRKTAAAKKNDTVGTTERDREAERKAIGA